MGEHMIQHSKNISYADFGAAMRLLGVDNDDPERALVSVSIKEGRVDATYMQRNIVSFAEARVEPPGGPDES